MDARRRARCTLPVSALSKVLLSPTGSCSTLAACPKQAQGSPNHQDRCAELYKMYLVFAGVRRMARDPRWMQGEVTENSTLLPEASRDAGREVKLIKLKMLQSNASYEPGEPATCAQGGPHGLSGQGYEGSR